MANGISLAEETERELRLELANCRERLAEARDEAFVHRQNFERAIQILAFFAPPDFTEILHDRMMQAWIDSVSG